MGSSNNNTDFQSELLRMNGSLQASITELRYHCEVYRLSLKSICKVLASVRKEQDARLRCLTTSRPSFQAYLLTLSQKQALERIKNVVRKASTFINGYSLVDKQLFQPPPPKPSTVRRGGDPIKTAPVTNTRKLTDESGMGWAQSCSSGGYTSTATTILPVISKEISTNKDKGGGESVSSKNNNGKVERKHCSGRRRRGGDEKKKTSGRRFKSKSRNSSRNSHQHSTTNDFDVHARHGESSGGGDNDDRTSREVKRSRNGKEKEKMRSRASSKNCSADTDSTIKSRSRERKKIAKQIRSKSNTAIRNYHDSYSHHHRRQQVINSRAFPSQQDEKLKEDNQTGVITSEPNKGRKELSSLMSQSGIVANRIPPLLSIATSSAIKASKTFGTSHVNEKLRTEARRVRRPSKEKEYEGRRTNTNSYKYDSQNNERAKKSISGSLDSRSIFTIRLNEIHESSKTTTTTRGTSATTTRWGNASTLTATKAGYKVRESLAVLRNRNNGNTFQGQGVAARKYLFSSHNKPRNNFKLNSTTNLSSACISTEKVRRIQLNGSSRFTSSFCRNGNINEEKPYGASRKFTSSNSSNNDKGNGNGSTNNNNGGLRYNGVS